MVLIFVAISSTHYIRTCSNSENSQISSVGLKWGRGLHLLLFLLPPAVVVLVHTDTVLGLLHHTPHYVVLSLKQTNKHIEYTFISG